MNYAIIAAGEGSRLAQEGIAKPKPLVELQGEPMIGRLINIMLRCNAESISIIVNEHMTEVREYLQALELPVPLNLVVKTTPSSTRSRPMPNGYIDSLPRKDCSGRTTVTTAATAAATATDRAVPPRRWSWSIISTLRFCCIRTTFIALGVLDLYFFLDFLAGVFVTAEDLVGSLLDLAPNNAEYDA